MALQEITEEEVENRLSSWPPAVDMSLHDELLRLAPVRVPSRARIFSDDDGNDNDNENTINTMANDHNDHQDFESRFLNAPADFFDAEDFSYVLADDDDLSNQYLESPPDHYYGDLYQQEVDRRTNLTDGLSEEIISQFLKSRTRRCQPSGGDDGLEETICVVCQCGYEESEEEEILVATLECGHEYHESCIHTWLTLKNSCPLCKREAIRES